MAVSAVNSYSTPEMTALSPSISPAPAIFRMSTLPSRELVESLTLPEHKRNMPRGSCPSTNNVAPGGYMVWWLIALKLFRIGAERLQKHSCRLSLQLLQLSTISKPYGVFMLPPN